VRMSQEEKVDGRGLREEVGEEGGGVVRRRPREMANISDERMRKRKINRGLDDQLGDDGRARRWQREMSCEKEMESGERSVRRVWFF
jgi:hypothetical protein